jgi:DNA-binding MarR family transcriptional regulator
MSKDTLRNPLEDLIGYQLRRASLALMGGLVRSLEVCDLKPVEASVLLLIEANPGITQSEIGRALGIQRANMAPLIAGFDRRGLVHRTRVDGRSQGLEITDDGIDVAEQARTAMEAHDSELIGRLPVDMQKTLVEGINMLWRGHDES